MTTRTTLSFTDRHHRFLTELVESGVHATTSAAVAAAIEDMMRAEEERRVMLGSLAETIRARAATPRDNYIDAEGAFAAILSGTDEAAKP
jgi:antitoxin ParD1/3/4